MQPFKGCIFCSRIKGEKKDTFLAKRVLFLYFIYEYYRVNINKYYKINKNLIIIRNGGE